MSNRLSYRVEFRLMFAIVDDTFGKTISIRTVFVVKETDNEQMAACGEEVIDAQTVGFLLISGFSMMSYASTVEPFRAANVLAGKTLYRWSIVSIDNQPVAASNGALIQPDSCVGDMLPLDIIFVCASGNPSEFQHPPTYAWLREISRRGTRIGAVSGGSYILARAQLLSGYRFTIHWEHIPAFVEEFPRLPVSRSRFEIDRDRLTCAGGVAALDMVHTIIAQDHGHHLAAAVSDWFLQSHIRSSNNIQRLSLPERFGTSNKRLLGVLEHMERNIEEPSSREALATDAGITTRQLDRLFAAHLHTSPMRYYMNLRLDRARNLVLQSSLAVTEIAVACGFAGLSHFSAVYKQRFGFSPRHERRRQHRS